MAITDTWLRSVHKRPREATEEKTDRDGMSARVTKTGKVVFQLRFRYQGKAARMDLGSYPGMSLKQARDEAVMRRSQVEQGHDPRKLKQQEIADRASRHTNESLIRLWCDHYLQHNVKDWAQVLRMFENHIFPKLGKLDADSTKATQWMDLLDPLSEKYPVVARRILLYAKQAHRWGRRRCYIDGQPLAEINSRQDLRSTGVVNSGRSLEDDEIRLIWQAMERTSLEPKSKAFVVMSLFFGCRPNELLQAERRDFDLEGGVWTIPAEKHKAGIKTGMPLQRAIIDEAKPLIRLAMEESTSPVYVFSKRNSREPMARGSVGNYPISIMRAAKRLLGEDMAWWSMYDLRKTARTNWSVLSDKPHVCELMLGHRLPGVWQVYDKHSYLSDQAEIYRAWWERITQILGESPIP